MYITETTEKVKELFNELNEQDNITKMRFILYIFNLLNNNQINNKNEANPDLEDDDFVIFNFQNLGFPNDYCLAFLLYNTSVYNKLIGKKEAYEDNGVIVGIGYNECDNELISKFEKLEFDEKLDIFSEIIIRYDNETYFDKRITMISFDTELSGFDIANIIKDFKSKY